MTGAYLKLLIMTLAVTLGQVCMKKGALKVRRQDNGRYILGSFFHPFLMIGAASVLFTPLLYFSALKTLPLSAAYGFTGLTYLFVFLASYLILKEKITRLHLAGILLISGGFILWNL
ncbi:MAG: EamA family transporter [Spirochaetales bacterium]|nr:EamA family transporter [Spirochaetales bacterium]